MAIDDTAESDIDKILAPPATRNLPMLTSTPSRSQSMKRVADWKSLNPAEQLEVLHEVGSEVALVVRGALEVEWRGRWRVL